MTWTVVVADSVYKALRRIPKKTQKLIMEKIAGLAENPFPFGDTIKRLQTEAEIYRLRVGDYRIFYKLIRDEMVVDVYRIANRREAYRDF